jgi:HD-GYP domain-containing protein (c-di-GMP phosphodiesterase class II)
VSLKEQKVSIGDVKVGMYVSRLDRPWLETRFLFQGFRIAAVADIEELRRHCEYVYIDVEKGLAATRTLDRIISQREKDPDAQVFRSLPATPVYPLLTSVEEEVGASRESRSQLIDVVTNILDELKAGHSIKLMAIRQSVSSMIASIIRNPDAFFLLSRLKDKDDYAYAHCVDACGLAVAFGRHLGFSKPELENLAVGVLLCDIGKLQLPDNLLRKPGRLTDSEYELVRRHVEFGAQMVRDMKDSNDEVVSIVMHHHERHNGKGYPNQVPGHLIPVKGRIAALVDCYDAITSERAYSQAVSAYDAINMIYEWRDKDFQSDMVEQFMQCIGLYPTGTLVERTTGEVGIVISQNRVRRLRPRVMMVLDKDKVALEFNPVVDLIEASEDEAEEEIGILHPLAPGSYGIEISDYYL